MRIWVRKRELMEVMKKRTECRRKVGQVTSCPALCRMVQVRI